MKTRKQSRKFLIADKSITYTTIAYTSGKEGTTSDRYEDNMKYQAQMPEQQQQVNTTFDHMLQLKLADQKSLWYYIQKDRAQGYMLFQKRMIYALLST